MGIIAVMRSGHSRRIYSIVTEQPNYSFDGKDRLAEYKARLSARDIKVLNPIGQKSHYASAMVAKL